MSGTPEDLQFFIDTTHTFMISAEVLMKAPTQLSLRNQKAIMESLQRIENKLNQ